MSETVCYKAAQQQHNSLTA